jgi:GT2 family glycosyltransferase
MLATGIETQGYPRTELIVMADGTACTMADEIAELSGNVRFLPFKDRVLNAEAWNRGIRESFAELLVLLEPGDRFQPDALDALVRASELKCGPAWIRGRVVSSGLEDESLSPLRGALIRKNAFRECGLFHADPFLQGREHLDWLRRAEEKRLTGHQLETVTLHAASAATIQRCRLLPEAALDQLRARNEQILSRLKANLDRRRQRGEAGNNPTA